MYVHFQRVLDNEDGSCNSIPGSEFVIAREASRDNTSRYFVDGRSSNFTAVTKLLRDYGVDLDNNRFLILQVSPTRFFCGKLRVCACSCGLSRSLASACFPPTHRMSIIIICATLRERWR